MSDPVTQLQARVGPYTAAEGQYSPFRAGRDGGIVTAASHGDFYEAVSRGNVYTLACGPTTTTIAAGNIIGATAAAAVQFAIWNPIGSGVNFALLEFVRGVVSGTPTGGAVVHGFLSTALADTLPTIANTAAAIPRNNLLGAASSSRAGFVSTVASSGTALTGATAVRALGATAFSGTATAMAGVSALQGGVERINGKIVLAPGSLWLPLEPGAGTTMLLYYSVTWEEIPA
jgi:hypothetical protein